MDRLNEGLRKSEWMSKFIDKDVYFVDYEHDEKTDLIKLEEIGMEPIHSRYFDYTYYYGYEFSDDVPKNIRRELTKAIRFYSPSIFMAEDTIGMLIDKAIKRLNQHIKLSSFSCIIFPKSKSPLNTNILKRLTRLNRVSLHTFELVKELPENISFDWERFESEILDDVVMVGGKPRTRYTEKQKKEKIESVNKILQSIKSSEYFSIADSVRDTKLRVYFDSFLKFKNSDAERLYKTLSRPEKNILILDDVATTGATLMDIIKTIRSVKDDNNLVVFTLLGKRELKF